MSVEAITWALRQHIPQSSTKFVLVVMANCASGDTLLAFPSSAYLSEATGQDRKTVLANLAKLRAWGLIVDTGERRGTTGQVIVYRLVCGPDLFTEQSQKRNRSENGTVPKTEGNSTVFPQQQSQKRDTEPSETKATKSESHAREVAEEKKPTPGGLAARALMDAKVFHVNPTDPRLLKLLESGVTIEELRDAACEAVKAGKGTLAYVCGVVRGRREDAAAAAALPGPVRRNSPSSHLPRVPEQRARGDPEATAKAEAATMAELAKTFKIPITTP